MANRIVLKRSSVALKVPLAGDLVAGELAVNLTDKVLYTKDASGNVVPLGGSGGGTGTVTGVSVTTANGVSGTVATSTTTPAISIALGAITPTSVAASGQVTGSNLSGTNTGDQSLASLGAYAASNPSAFISSINSGNVTTALGFTPYNATNPTGYITSAGNAATATTATNSTQLGGFSKDYFVYGDSGNTGSINTYIPDGGIGANAIARSCFFRDNTSNFTALGIHIQHSNSSGYGVQIGSDYGGTVWQVRGKVAGTWGSIATLLTSGNYTGYAPSLTGSGASGTWGINITGSAATATDSSKLPLSGGANMTGSFGLNDSKLYLRGNGDNNHALWNAADDWEELIAYSGTGFRVASSTGTTLATFTTSGSNINTVNATRFSAPNNGLISIGDDSATNTYNDGGTRSRLYVSSAYPVVTINSTVQGGNGNHGPTLQFSTNGYDSGRHWVIGTGGTGQALDFGTAQAGNRNPHEGIAGYSGSTPMRITVGSNVGIGGSWGPYGLVTDPSYRLHVQGTGYASSDFRAPIFYDANDTYYNVDPNGTSRLSNRLYLHNWIEFVNYAGLYSPNNGAYFYPNDASYGSWRVAGSRNGWSGLEFDASNGQQSMMVSTGGNTVGWHNNSYGWKFFWETGRMYCYDSTYGGGPQRMLLMQDTWQGTKYFGSGGEIYTTIVYDANNSGYYCDPNNTSRMNAVVADNLYAYGTVTAYYSDDRLKTRFNNIVGALDKVCSLNGFFYEANEVAEKLGYKKKREVGLSAQEVQRILPEIISPAPIDEQYMTIQYDRVVPLLVEAIKELRLELNQLKSLVKI